jgi:hypothetical protein
MKLLYDKSKGRRLRHQFAWIQTRSQKGQMLWWDSSKKVWGEEGNTNCVSCYSVKAFKRHIKKHPELKGCKVILVSDFVGCDVICYPK